MIPLRDSIRSSTTPWVNYAIIAACVAVWLGQLLRPDHLAGYMLVPREFVDPRAWVHLGLGGIALRVLTSMFMHGGLLHLGGNMLFLWVFGDNVEDRMGHARYLAFYLLCGAIAALCHTLLSFFSDVPILGASGAIAGVLGAYLVLFRGATVRALVPIFFIFTVVEIPAVIFLGLWFVFQLFSGIGTIGATGGGVAFWAHIGGFVAGYLLAKRFASRSGRPVQPRILRVRYR
jgi:membrane associated rhomboid family serine protease